MTVVTIYSYEQRFQFQIVEGTFLKKLGLTWQIRFDASAGLVCFSVLVCLLIIMGHEQHMALTSVSNDEPLSSCVTIITT